MTTSEILLRPETWEGSREGTIKIEPARSRLRDCAPFSNIGRALRRLVPRSLRLNFRTEVKEITDQAWS
jgi:hypothetical protein